MNFRTTPSRRTADVHLERIVVGGSTTAVLLVVVLPLSSYAEATTKTTDIPQEEKPLADLPMIRLQGIHSSEFEIHRKIQPESDSCRI